MTKLLESGDKLAKLADEEVFDNTARKSGR